MNPIPNYVFLAIFIVMVVVFAVVPLILARVWAHFYGPKRVNSAKRDTYECGLEGRGDAWVPLRSDYYLYAILFLIFDVETVFLLPFAVVFKVLPLGALLGMMFFLLLLVEGLAWAWAKGILSADRKEISE